MSINSLPDFFSLCSGNRQKEAATSNPDPISRVFSGNPPLYSPLLQSEPQIDSTLTPKLALDFQETSEPTASIEQNLEADMPDEFIFEEDPSETSLATSPSIISEEESEAKMPDEFDFEDEYEEISDFKMSTDPEARLIGLAEETLEDLFAKAHELKKLKSPDAARVKKRAKRLKKELNRNEKPKAVFSVFKKEQLDLDVIPNQDVSANDRKTFVNKLFKNIAENYQREDRIQVLTIFLSKLNLSLDEVTTLMVRLQEIEGTPGSEHGGLDYTIVAKHYRNIPKYQNASEELQKKMDQFLIDADRRMAIQKEEAIRKDQSHY